MKQNGRDFGEKSYYKWYKKDIRKDIIFHDGWALLKCVFLNHSVTCLPSHRRGAII